MPEEQVVAAPPQAEPDKDEQPPVVVAQSGTTEEPSTTAALGRQALEAIPEEIEASFDDLIKKQRRIHRFYVMRQNDDGSTTKMKVTFQAMDPVAYDELREKHPPTDRQKKDGYAFNPDTFAPALISAVSHTPKMTPEQAKALYTSPNYATGEREGLFMHAQYVCNAAVDVPFTEPG